MPNLTLKFNAHINDSVQVGDILFYSPTTNTGNVNTVTAYSNIKKMGPVLNIVRKGRSGGFITIDHDVAVSLPTISDFLFFSKDNKANLSSLIGYYAELKFINTSIKKAEIYQIGVEINESSK